MTQSQLKNTQWLVYRYVTALDTGDLDEIETILKVAQNDTRLDQIISEINQTYAEEMGLTPMAQAIEKVRRIVAQFFNDPLHIELMPLTIGDVAARMTSDQELPKNLRETSKSLLRNTMTLPEMIGMREIQKLAAKIKIADDKFWRSFRDAALQMMMGRGQAQMLATRSRRPKKSSPPEDKGEQSNENL